jgi:hypothetical protein
VVDVSKGVGGELEHYKQNNVGEGGLEPLIPLGLPARCAGHAQARPWQVVGYQERCDLPAPGDDDEQVFWREYLLYNREHGFAFLVDAEDGWSWVRPITGTPKSEQGDKRQLAQHHLPEAHLQLPRQGHLGAGRVLLARAPREEKARVTDYVGSGNASGRERLSLEQTAERRGLVGRATLDANGGGPGLRHRRPGQAPSGATRRRCRPMPPRSRQAGQGYRAAGGVRAADDHPGDLQQRRLRRHAPRLRREPAPNTSNASAAPARAGHAPAAGSWGGYSSGGGGAQVNTHERTAA